MSDFIFFPLVLLSLIELQYLFMDFKEISFISPANWFLWFRLDVSCKLGSFIFIVLDGDVLLFVLPLL